MDCIYIAPLSKALYNLCLSFTHSHTNGNWLPWRYQPARKEQLGVRCLAQGHFDTPRVGSNRQPSDCLLSHIALIYSDCISQQQEYQSFAVYRSFWSCISLLSKLQHKSMFCPKPKILEMILESLKERLDLWWCVSECGYSLYLGVIAQVDLPGDVVYCADPLRRKISIYQKHNCVSRVQKCGCPWTKNPFTINILVNRSKPLHVKHETFLYIVTVHCKRLGTL